MFHYIPTSNNIDILKKISQDKNWTGNQELYNFRPEFVIGQ